METIRRVEKWRVRQGVAIPHVDHREIGVIIL